jgi:hypothetical protein
MGFFEENCIECKSTKDVQSCQYCKKQVCAECLKRLVYREAMPSWFVGKGVHNFEEFKKLNKEYCKIIKSKGGNIHCCEQYLEYMWNLIAKEAHRLEEDRHQKAAKIILK